MFDTVTYGKSLKFIDSSGLKFSMCFGTSAHGGRWNYQLIYN